jgi:hypothetical protein
MQCSTDSEAVGICKCKGSDCFFALKLSGRTKIGELRRWDDEME